MNIRILNKYMELCQELRVQPSVEGLVYFKKAFK